ncbi:MAG: lysylphosphatidylglycerol synthase transmembrane domain-containing protein [Candidatus Bipolaricaulaceae bacterium]
MKTSRVLLISTLLMSGVGLFGALIYISGPRQVFHSLTQAGLPGFLAVWGNVLGALAAWLVSWSVLLRACGIAQPWAFLGSALLAGFSISYLTPSMYLGGEPVRAYMVATRAEVPMAQVMATVVVERMLAGLSLFFFASVGGFFALISPRLTLADKQAVGIGLGLVAVLLLLGVFSFSYSWLSRIIRLAARVLPGRGRLLRAASKVAETEQEIQLAFTVRFKFTALAFLFQMLTVFFNYLRPQVFFYFAKRTAFTVPQLSLYFTLNSFLTAFLWITPGGIGVAEGGRIGIFSLLDITSGEAMAYSVAYRFVELILAGLGLTVLLRRGLLRMARGREPAQGKLSPQGGSGDD